MAAKPQLLFAADRTRTVSRDPLGFAPLLGMPLLGILLATMLAGLPAARGDDSRNLAAQYLVDRGTAKLERGDRAGALSDFGKAITSDPLATESYWIRSQLHQQRNELTHAVADLSSYLRLRPFDAVALFNRGLCFQKLNLAEKAIADYALAALPTANTERVVGSTLKFRARARLYRARLWEARGQPAEAAADYSAALQMDPAARGIYLERGLAYAAAGEYELAKADYRRAYTHNPNSYRLLTAWAWLLATCPAAEVRDGAEALRLIKRCRRRDAWCQDVTAAAYAELSRFDEALAILQPLAEQFDPRQLSRHEQTVLDRIELYRRGRAYRDRNLGPERVTGEGSAAKSR